MICAISNSKSQTWALSYITNSLESTLRISRTPRSSITKRPDNAQMRPQRLGSEVIMGNKLHMRTGCGCRAQGGRRALGVGPGIYYCLDGAFPLQVWKKYISCLLAQLYPPDKADREQIFVSLIKNLRTPSELIPLPHIMSQLPHPRIYDLNWYSMDPSGPSNEGYQGQPDESHLSSNASGGYPSMNSTKG